MDRLEERGRILDWDSWPLGFKLPMKNYRKVKPGELAGTGFLLSSDVAQGKFIVYLGNVFFSYTVGQLFSLQREIFNSVDEMMDGGWHGD